MQSSTMPQVKIEEIHKLKLNTTRLAYFSGRGDSIRTFWKLLPVILMVIVFTFPSVIAKGIDSDHQRGKSHLVTNAEWVRRRSKSSECRLGGTRHPLNSTWSPDLGPPFGTWNCVKCTCTPVQKKRRIVAKVRCKNVKTECPTEPKCKNPVLYPGACCKVCPDQSFKHIGRDFVHEENVDEDEAEFLAEKDFAVLLNGRTSRSPLTTRRLATGRIFLRRGSLHFSFLMDQEPSHHSSPTTTIQFLDDSGNILEELEAQPTPYEVNNGRICGSWTRVPRQYRKLLLKEMMWVSLFTEGDAEDEMISGRIARYKGVNTEVFSALLSPVHNRGAGSSPGSQLPSGGTAIISVSAPSDSLHVSLVFNGISGPGDERNVTVFVELTPARALDPVKDRIILQKVFSDINEADVLTTLGETSLRLLTRGKVSIRLWAASAPELALEGPITSRATCNVFHAVLTTSFSPSPPFGSGWGLLFLTNDGDFEYQIRIKNLKTREKVEGVLLDTEGRRKVREVEDVTHALSEDGSWVNGTYGRPTFRDLDTLLRGRLRVSVLLTDGGVLEGTFDSVSVTEALRSLHPTLLTAPSTTPLAATAWVAVDEDCVMHYDVRLAGGDKDPSSFYGIDPTWSLTLRENDTAQWDPRLDQESVTLERAVSGREVAAHTVHLTKISLSRLHHGASFLDLAVVVSSSSVAVLSARLTDVRVPPFCLLEGGGGGPNQGRQPEVGVQVDSPCKGFVCLDEEVPPVVSKKCIDHKKKVYDDGTTWRSPVSNCARCMCTLGVIKCENEPCPKPTCPNAVILEGQCCPSCPVVRGQVSERVCEMDGDFHIIGAFWHPFLAPNGFDKCVTCYCNVTSNSAPLVECKRASCPRLNCRGSLAKFEDGSCCPTCPAISGTPSGAAAAAAAAAAPPTSPLLPPPPPPPAQKGMINEDTLIAIADRKSNEEILAGGGCLERMTIVRPNGDVWFPKLSPNGASRCVSCTCKDGVISCVPKKCPPDKECKKGRRCRSRRRNKFYRKQKNYMKGARRRNNKKRREKEMW